MKILQLLADVKEVKPLSSWNFVPEINQKQNKRMLVVIEHILTNLQNELSLAEVAQLIYMTPASFSRFFKQAAKKPFIKYVNQLRISKACHFLINTDETITQIALQCGYGNLSNFNRQFQKIKISTPSAYRNRYKHALD